MRSLKSVRVQIIFVLLTIASVLLITAETALSADTATPGADKTADAPSPKPLPSLAEVIYQAGTLKQRLAALESKPATRLDLKKYEAQLKQADAEANQLQERLKVFNDQDLQSYQKLAAFKSDVRNQADDVKGVVNTLNEWIKALEHQRRRWRVDKDRWDQWRSTLQMDLEIPSVASTFDRANRDIETALSLLSQRLEPLLVVQLQAA